mgnify:CR=1 FL=1
MTLSNGIYVTAQSDFEVQAGGKVDWKQELTTIYPVGRVFFEEPMARHTTFRIGGPAEAYVIPTSEEQIARTVAICKEAGVSWTVIGNGSNLLVSDAGVRGVVIRMEGSAWHPIGMDENKVLFQVTAGTLFSSFAKAVSKEGYTGLEYATGIPGSVGGAVVMNAGAYGGEVKDSLVYADVLTKEGTVERRMLADLDLSYRHSNVSANGDTVISAVFAIEKSDNADEVAAKVMELAEKRKEKQPLEYPSAGSTFKRPEGYFAGKLIDDCGLRGFQIGGAQVSEKHCGFVINKENATAADVCNLISEVQRIVYERFGVELETEVKFLGF